MAFLNKANEDTSNGHAASVKNKQPAQFKTKDSGSQVPGPIQAAVSDAVYTSDADEPFEAVSLKWEGNGLPDEGESYRRQSTLHCPLVMPRLSLSLCPWRKSLSDRRSGVMLRNLLT